MQAQPFDLPREPLTDDRALGSTGDQRSSSRSISLVVFANGESSDKQIWQIVRSLGIAKWRTEVLLVDPDATAVHSTHNDQVNGQALRSRLRLTYRPVPRVFKTVDEAIAVAKHSSVLIADPSTGIESAEWGWVASRLCDSKIQSYFQRPSATGYKKLLLAICQLFVHMLLKTRKSEFNSGFVVMPRRLAPKRSLSQSSHSTPAQSFETAASGNTLLLAAARLATSPIEEVEIRSPHADHIQKKLHSKQLLRSTKNVVRVWWNQIMFPVGSQQDPSLQSKTQFGWQLAAWAALLIAISTILFSNLNYPLFEPDEARNAQLAINIISSGDWMSLTLAGEPYWDKPPFQMWAIASSYQLFCVSPCTTRLPGALATALTVLLTLAIGRKLVGFRAAFLAALLLLLSSGFVLIGRYVTMDSSLTCSVFLLSCSLMLAFKERIKPKWLVVAGISAGIGFLVKGPVVLVLGFPPAVAALWLARNRSFSRPRTWLWFAVPFALVAAPWFLATSLVHPEFVEYFFWKHHVVRFSDAFNHREPFWYFLPAILIMMFPASYLMPSLIKFVGSRSESNRNLRSASHGFLALFAIWIIGFFSMSESKLPTYILPALPPLCLLMGVLLDKKIISPVESGWEKSKLAQRKSFLDSLPQRNPIELLCLLVITFYTVQTIFAAGMPWPLIVSATILTASLVVVSRRPQTPTLAAWSCLGLLAFCFVIAGVNHLAPRIAESRSVHSAARYLRSTDELRDAPVVFFGREKYGVSLTLPPDHVRYFESDEADSVCSFLKEHPRSIIVSSKKQMTNLRRMLDWTIVIKTDESARHLYHTSPNPVLNAKATSDSETLMR